MEDLTSIQDGASAAKSIHLDWGFVLTQANHANKFCLYLAEVMMDISIKTGETHD